MVEPTNSQSPDETPSLPALPDDDVDFAGEHDETTFADNVPGGPERAAEEESPSGHAGMD
ncbi:MAG TPA: hypothetical protein VK453_14025 [Micromonosporaceae bacterium]|nr:hypothetical protein [Micromonosporaceae bacterium]